MRIISGEFKSRRFKDLSVEGTRPTMERVKESLFSMIDFLLPDATVLDLFAGSGSLGFEALSRGSKHVYFNDFNRLCTNYIKEVSGLLNVNDRVSISNLDYKKFLRELKEKIDIIILDPPYKKDINEVLEEINKYNILNQSGIIICEVDNLNINLVGYQIYKEKKYGDKYIVILKGREKKVREE